MTFWALILPVVALAASPVMAQDAQDAQERIVAPSGFQVTLHEQMVEEHPYSGEILVIVRLVAPAIVSPVVSANLQTDMEWACETWGLPTSDALATPADRIIVELMAAPVPRGEASPDTRRFFETYSPQDGLCIWELF